MIRDVGQSMAIGDNHFEVIKKFVNLGSLNTPTNDVSLEIQRRIQKIRHSQDLIHPVLLYGSETWVLTK
jgi:hypothetical protein